MNGQTIWQWLGLVLIAVGVWGIAWAPWHWNAAPLPGFRYVVSLQASRLVGGVAFVVVGSLFYTKVGPS